MGQSTSVLILILMEYSLRQYLSQHHKYITVFVLILILMEYSLRRVEGLEKVNVTSS